MAVLKEEIRLVNNAALGAYLLWNYSLAYQDQHEVRESTPGVLLFLILPILFNQPTLDFLDKTKRGSGLFKFSEKFLSTEHKKSHLLLDVHERVIEMREITLLSLKIAIKKNLLTVVPSSGKIVAVDEEHVGKPRGVPAIVIKMKRNSEKLGYWFSENSLKDISFYMKVFF
jgi:Family of unknown function (DUF6521)